MNLFGIRIVFDRKGETKAPSKKEALVQIEVVDKVYIITVWDCRQNPKSLQKELK